jgi:hypothetical protein
VAKSCYDVLKKGGGCWFGSVLICKYFGANSGL